MNLKHNKIVEYCAQIHNIVANDSPLLQLIWTFLVSFHESATFIAVTKPAVRGKMKRYEMEAIWFNLI